MPPKYREVKSITMKRAPIVWDLPRRLRPRSYGHWWFEIGDPDDPASESYGWWPKEPVDLKGTFGGVEGELNGQTFYRGTATRDPYHGAEPTAAKPFEMFHPFVRASDPRTDAQIATCLRTFARNYSGHWQWVFEKGQNCHSFQEEAMAHCKLWKVPPRSFF
jgi:hypothetical protein